MHNFICMGPRQHYTKRRPWLVAPVGRECLELVMSPVCIQYFERAWMQLRHCKNEPNIIIMVRSCSLRQNWSSKIAKQPADHMGASSPLIVCTYFCFLIPFQCLYYHIFYHWIWSEFIMWCPCLCLIKVEVPVSALILGCAPIGCGWAGDVPESTAESTVLQVGYGGMVGWWEVPLVMLWKRPNTGLLFSWLRPFSAMFEWGRASPFSFLASVDILMNYIIFCLQALSLGIRYVDTAPWQRGKNISRGTLVAIMIWLRWFVGFMWVAKTLLHILVIWATVWFHAYVRM